MSLVMIAFLALFIPGLLTIALVVAYALPRALRDLKEQQRALDRALPPADAPEPSVSEDSPAP